MQWVWRLKPETVEGVIRNVVNIYTLLEFVKVDRGFCVRGNADSDSLYRNERM